MKIKKMPVDKIVPYDRNPRKITDEAIDAVAESITRYGFNQPIVVDKDMVIIAGHTRWNACKKLGLKEVFVMVSDMNEAAAREYRIADNKTNELAGWDWDKFVWEMRAVGDLGTMDVFFPDLDLKKFMDQWKAVRPVEQEKVDAHQAKLDNLMVERGEIYLDKLLQIPCEACGKEFGVDVSKLISRIKRDFT